MAHNTRTQPDATWTTGNYVPLVADWQSLDAKLFAAVNGDRGGCWAPSSPLVVNGIALTSQMNVTGPTVIDFGGTISLVSNATVRLGAGDWPRFSASHVLRSRTIVTSCLQRQAAAGHSWINNIALGAVQSIACSVQLPAYTSSVFAQAVTPGRIFQPAFALPLRVHDGSRFTLGSLTFRVNQSRTAAPVVAPQFRIVRVDLSGNVVPLKSVASGADASGYVSVANPASGAAWYAGGALQTINYVCDQNNVIDVSQYSYFAQLIEEVGTTAQLPAQSCDGTIVRERKVDVVVASTANLASLSGTQTVDGVSVGSASPIFPIADRVLLKDQTDKTQNGIWIAQSAVAWVRASDLTGQADFTPGFLVKATQGTVNAGTIWECRDPVNTQQVTLSTPTGTPVNFQRRTPRGNVYHAVACSFDSIADMRWQ
jgi:hypothetical protein